MAKTITIIGGTGHIGRTAAEILRKKGHTVRPVSRKGEFAADAEDKDAMAKVMQGADSVFMMIPPNYATDNLRAYQNRVGAAQAEGAKKAGVKHVVLLSSIGGHLSQGTGPILGVHDQEERLKYMGFAVDIMRPCYFMENHLNAIGAIKSAGSYIDAMAADHPFPQVATRDIGEKAARLLESGEGGKVHYVYGPKEYSMSEAAKVLGGTIGKPNLGYVQAPYDQVKKALMGFGISDSVASAFMEMEKGFNEGRITPTEMPGAGNRGKETLEEFAKTVFAPAFRG